MECSNYSIVGYMCCERPRSCGSNPFDRLALSFLMGEAVGHGFLLVCYCFAKLEKCLTLKQTIGKAWKKLTDLVLKMVLDTLIMVLDIHFDQAPMTIRTFFYS